MFKFVCLLALIAVVAAMPNGQIVKREAVAPGDVLLQKDSPVLKSTVEAQDDLDNAETFGFGYHKVIHVGAPYVYYGGYHDYPGYYYGYHGYPFYGHYW